LFPRINPLEHVVVERELKPAFFVSGFQSGETAGKKPPVLRKSHHEYLLEIESATPAQLRSVAASELLKVSFIRDMKFRLIKKMSSYLTICFLLFLVLLALDTAGKSKRDSKNPSIINNSLTEVDMGPACARQSHEPSSKSPVTKLKKQ
jgi:hypothetical protein